MNRKNELKSIIKDLRYKIAVLSARIENCDIEDMSFISELMLKTQHLKNYVQEYNSLS